jgi:hypothetical protein
MGPFWEALSWNTFLQDIEKGKDSYRSHKKKKRPQSQEKASRDFDLSAEL